MYIYIFFFFFADGTKSNSTTEVTSNSNQPTIIQIPENLLPMFLPKKDPIKIGKF